MSVDQTSWEAAVRHLYEDAYPYDATGPRRHENWVLDVLALMARAPDPRGWTGLDDAAQNPEREASPPYPFVAHPPEYIARRLQEIDRDSAENLLLALTDDRCTLSNLSRSPKARRSSGRWRARSSRATETPPAFTPTSTSPVT